MADANTVTMPAKEYDKLLRDHAKERVMEFGRNNKGALYAIGAGAAGYWLLTSKWLNDITLFKEHWWLKSLVTLIFGWWLHRKGNPWAGHVLTLGAALFVRDWKASHPDTETKGPGEDEAGALDWNKGQQGRWVKTQNGAHIYVMDGGGGGAAAEHLGNRVYAQAS